MSLTNAQYDEIMRQYSRKQLKAQETARKKKKQLYSQAPELSQIDAAIASVSVSCARSYIRGEKSALEHIDEKIQALSQKKEEILASLGSSSKDLEPAYECPLCKDTGYINGKKCRCFKQAEIDLVYEQSNIRSVLQKENFQNFRLSYYSDEIRDPANGLTSLELAKYAVSSCKQFVEDFQTEAPNLLLYGNTGTGKTFLTNCVAKELLDRGFSVIYFSAFRLFDILAKNTFGKHPEIAGDYHNIFNCDLLIIDDLGTEGPNSFTISQLFQCINERILRKKSTIISTNLSLKNIADIYSERISSRITSSFTLLKLYGEDIRILQKLSD